MKISSKPRYADRLRALLHLDDPPAKIALALAVGVFISCTPFLGLQTLLAILLSTIFPLNRAATVTGVWINLPWFAPFVYGAALKVGALLIPDPDGARDAWLRYVVAYPGRLSWQQMLALFQRNVAAVAGGNPGDRRGRRARDLRGGPRDHLGTTGPSLGLLSQTRAGDSPRAV